MINNIISIDLKVLHNRSTICNCEIQANSYIYSIKIKYFRIFTFLLITISQLLNIQVHCKLFEKNNKNCTCLLELIANDVNSYISITEMTVDMDANPHQTPFPYCVAIG